MDYRQQQIDNYHSGRMTPEEMKAFESKLSTDPSLKAESDFQREIIDGLKDYRKTQLKARLDAVDLTPSWGDFIQQSTLVKSMGGVAVATIIGAGIYFFAEPVENPDGSEAIVIDAPAYEAPEVIWGLGEEQSVPKSAELAEVVEPSTTVQQVTTEENVVSAVEPQEEVVVVKEDDKKTFTPSFQAPDANTVEEEEVLAVSNLDKLPKETSGLVKEKPIDVETETTSSINVRYKYYDGKLFLSGDFDRAPYEILEINSASGRRIYVKYLDKYYKVGITDRLTDLPEVTDVEVIKELDLLRSNK